ncbi:hypothetical protein EOM89_02600 [Candidatus Falkowbacteria bacterium]|nr:hypothetical protein [Candidatus Falkowbacteria bacterium]
MIAGDQVFARTGKLAEEAEQPTVMGWSIRYASQVIKHYAVISEDETDRVNRALEAAQKAKNGTKL